MKDHTADELRKLMNDSKSVLQILIDKLPGDFLKAQPCIQEEIAPLLIDMENGKLQHYVKLLAGKVKASPKVIIAEIDSAREARKKKEEEKKVEVKIDPEVEKGALAIANDPFLFKKRLDAINAAGVVGERTVIGMYMCTLDSRLVAGDPLNPNTLAIKNAGHFGAGKSYTLARCVQIYPDESYVMITNGSAKSLYYLQGGLKQKCLIVTEGFQFQQNNAADSELVYCTRSLISEGCVSYCVVEKDENGKLMSVEKKLDGPTSFITTTNMENLEGQLEDRLFTIHPDEGMQQTKDIITMTGLQNAGLFKGLDQKTIDTWKQYHRLLKPVQVIIPFAPKIADYINQSPRTLVAARRASKRVMIVVKTVACAYQHQRKKDDQGRIIAEISDYWMSLQIVNQSFRENLGQQDVKTEERILFIEEKGAKTTKELAEAFGVSTSAITQWSKKKLQDGILTWCNEGGCPFTDDKELKRAKHSGTAYLKKADDYDHARVAGLPAPFELTQDPDWNDDGKLLRMYDLELHKKSSSVEVLSGVKEVLSPSLNTLHDREAVNSIQESDVEDKGVKVLSEKSEDEENIYVEDQSENGDKKISHDSSLSSSDIIFQFPSSNLF